MILIATQCFAPATGGIENLMTALAQALVRRGEDIRVFADRSGANYAGFDRSQPFVIQRYGGWKPWRRRRKARAIDHVASTLSAPALITDSWKSLELIDTRAFGQILCLVHGTEIPRHTTGRKAARLRRAFAKAGHVIANSEYTATRVRAFLTENVEPSVILPGITAPVTDPAIDQTVRQRLADHDPVLITLARLESRKGQADVINMLPRLIGEFPRLLYVIAGDGKDRAVLESAVEAAGLREHVLFTGSIRDPEKSAWLKHSNLFIMPGKQVGNDVEGFGLAYLEAALHGVPAIATAVGGAPEAVLDRKTGRVCPPDDAGALYQTTLELLRDCHARDSLGTNAKTRAQTFLWENKIDEYLALLAHPRA